MEEVPGPLPGFDQCVPIGDELWLRQRFIRSLGGLWCDQCCSSTAVEWLYAHTYGRDADVNEYAPGYLRTVQFCMRCESVNFSPRAIHVGALT